AGLPASKARVGVVPGLFRASGASSGSVVVKLLAGAMAAQVPPVHSMLFVASSIWPAQVLAPLLLNRVLVMRTVALTSAVSPPPVGAVLFASVRLSSVALAPEPR